MSNEDLDFVKAKTNEAALSSYRTYINNVSQNLYQKGNSVVINDRQDYIKKMHYILSDQKKFTMVNLKDDTLLNFAVNQEKHVDKVLKKLVESKIMTEKKNRKSLKPVGSRPAVMYDSSKVNRSSVENCLSY